MWLEILREYLSDLKIHRKRAVLTLLAVTWGTVAIVVLLSFGEGLKNQTIEDLLNSGDKVIVFYGGVTGEVYKGLPRGRRIQLTEADLRLLRRAVPEIELSSPTYRKKVVISRSKFRARTECEGVEPEMEEMRRMHPVLGGRFINDRDVFQSQRVVFLGGKIAREIFGSEEPVGKTVMLDNLPFTVIGLMQRKIQLSMEYGPEDRRAIIPSSTFRVVFGTRYASSLMLRPYDPSEQQYLKRRVFEVLGKRHRFSAHDVRALRVSDYIEFEKTARMVTLGMTIFLGLLGFFTLLVAGVGVANIMFVTVKERTREIGVRMAVGAKRSHIMAQFVFEALFLAFSGGFVGLLIAWGIVSSVRLLPAEGGAMQYLGRPIVSLAIVSISVFVLTFIALAAGFYPARKAASVGPAESLRYE